MRLVCLAAALLVTTSASAQLTTIRRLPPPSPPPSPDAPAASVSSDISRKLQLLEIEGLRVGPTGIQSPVLLSPKRPWIDARTHLEPVGPVQYRVNGDTILFQHDGDEGSYLNLSWSADPSRRHIVDCAVSETMRPMRYSWSSSGRSMSSEVSPDKGRVAVVLPAGAGGKVGLHSTGNWRFHGCEITPVDA